MNDLMNAPLYSVAGEIGAILATEEWTEETEQALDALQMAMEKKAGSIVALVQRADSRAAEIGAEIDRLTAWKKAVENRGEWLRRYLLAAMKAAERMEIEAGAFRLKIQANPPAAVCTGTEEATPARFLVIVPEQKRPDKKAIADALKKGEEIPGWELRRGERLVIR